MVVAMAYVFDLPRFVSTCGTTKILRRMHGVESMRMIGWDLAHWGSGSGDWPSSSCDVLCSMAGNAWSSWHFVPFFTSIMCNLPWADIMRDNEKFLEEQKAEDVESRDDECSSSELGANAEETQDVIA